MKTIEEIKTVDIENKTWFDRVCGNTYYSSRIIINYGQTNSETYFIPFNYGDGGNAFYNFFDHIFKKYGKEGVHYGKGAYSTFRVVMRELGIIVRTNTKEGKKKDVQNWGKCPDNDTEKVITA
jgi:hypothetical protein